MPVPNASEGGANPRWDRGKRQIFEVQVLRSRPYQTRFGSGHMYEFGIWDGNHLLYFSSRSGRGRDGFVQLDDTFDLKCTVKEHRTDKDGAAVTIITRACVELSSQRLRSEHLGAAGIQR